MHYEIIKIDTTTAKLNYPVSVHGNTIQIIELNPSCQVSIRLDETGNSDIPVVQGSIIPSPVLFKRFYVTCTAIAGTMSLLVSDGLTLASIPQTDVASQATGYLVKEWTPTYTPFKLAEFGGKNIRELSLFCQADNVMSIDVGLKATTTDNINIMDSLYSFGLEVYVNKVVSLEIPPCENIQIWVTGLVGALIPSILNIVYMVR